MFDFVWFQNVVLPVLGMGLGAFAMYAVYRTVNRHLDRRHERQMASSTGGGVSNELEDLRARLESLEDMALRLQDLEERVDFAERMLAQHQRQRLDAGGGS